MSLFSIALGCLASVFAVHNAGNLKEAWNKPYDSFKNSSFVSTKVKWGFNFADKVGKTAIPTLIAIDNLTGNHVKTTALQTVLDMTGGKLPKTGSQLAKNVAQVVKDAKDTINPQSTVEIQTEKEKEMVTNSAKLPDEGISYQSVDKIPETIETLQVASPIGVNAEVENSTEER